MSEPKIGRLVVASLHQAIAEAIPLKLEFYENWLKPLGLLKEGRVIGAASFSAALSFLRREDPADRYHEITRRAGELAAVWTYEELGWTRKRWLRMLPTRMRMRAALRLAREIARAAYPGSRIGFRINRDGGQVEVRGSVFCQVRERVDRPLCGFYEGVIVKLMELIGIGAEVRLARCRASGGAATCQIQLVWDSSRAPAPVAEKRTDSVVLTE
jgi:predicted hydrocarbon binding protein